MFLTKLSKQLKFIPLLAITLTNYQIAKKIQSFLITLKIDYQTSITIPWILIGFIPSLAYPKQSGLLFNPKQTIKNQRQILSVFIFLAIAFCFFYFAGITKYFHSVKNPLLFYLTTPIAEELIFRGWIFGLLQKHTKHAITVSALLFGIHHLQYFGYTPTPFALFQITYTFFLGLFLGHLRNKSGSLYLGLLAHILLNYFTLI